MKNGNPRRSMEMGNKSPSAMECWHFIAPLIPITDDEMTHTIYVKTFRAFKLLEEEEKGKRREDAVSVTADKWNSFSEKEKMDYIKSGKGLPPLKYDDVCKNRGR